MNPIFITAGIVVGAIILFASILAFVNRNYIRIPPNKAAVVFGREFKHKIVNADGTISEVKKGYKLIAGGGFFRIPILDEVQFMNLSNRMIKVKVDDAPNRDGVMTTVEGVANVKFASEINLLSVAAERFGEFNDTEINTIILQNLEGHLRAVVGKMTMEALIGDKTELNKAVLEEANDDFNKMGINIDFLNIQDIRDNDNYIINMGRKRAAEIKRDAEIGSADAERDAVIKTTQAKRAGIEEANINDVKIAESNRTLGVRQAEMKAEIDKENEIANQAGPLSQAQALKAVVEAQAYTEAAAEKAGIAVQEQKALKEKARYNAELVVPASARREQVIIDADAQKQSFVIEAEGKREAQRIIAEGEAKAIVLTKTAEADGEAAIIRKRGEAEGDAIYAKLSAEAKGTLEKAEAYAKLDQTGKFLEVLTALQTLGPNIIKEFAGVMAAATAHLGNIKDVKIVDFGGGQNGGSSTGKFGTIPVEIITKFTEGLKGTGMDLTKLLGFIGMKPDDLISTLPDTSEGTTTIKK